MNLKDLLLQKRGIYIELLLFFAVCLSTLPVSIKIPAFVIISIGSLRIRKISFNDLGLSLSDFNVRNIIYGLFIALCYFGLFHFLVDPLLSKVAQPKIPSAFNIKGNLPMLIQWLLVSWIVAAFGEEIIFRGYLVNRLNEVISNNIAGKLLVIILAGVAFGMVHFYQGLHGVLSAGLIGISQASIYIARKMKLTLPVIAHGAYDTIGFVLLFAGLNP
jgi:membrane protease YdiL (CAAX protease family)